ncbi:MAG: aminotransferase class V-fold PLP-dependent enzyme [Anaerolineales bacterium]|nr:aminotransferase class V-fold PLP-dependent enzyme [Anaerolineales bacterium]
MRELFLLDPEITFLNHGSFGATPKPVWDVYLAWQARLERQPVKFMARELSGELKKARRVLGQYLNADADDLVFIPNATFGVNLVARSLDLKPDDEILMTDHEYGACENVWEFLSTKKGFKAIRQPIRLPLRSPQQVAEQFWQGVTSRTRAIFISHITSPTAIRLPVELICRYARAAGIMTIIDGAHAPGQIAVDLEAIDPDFYLGNCHKWMMSPKGAGFLYTRKAAQPQVEPLVVSWGWGENASYSTGSRYIDRLEWCGTKDPSAYLSVPAAISFQAEHAWPKVQSCCQEILSEAIDRLNFLTGLETIYLPECEPFVQMAVARLPGAVDLVELKQALDQQYRVEVPCIQWGEEKFIRVSVQGYNTPSDIDLLVTALESLLQNYLR